MKIAVATVATIAMMGVWAAKEEMPVPDEAYVAEIAKHLPEKAGLVGFRPEDRPRWAQLAKDPKAKTIIREAEGLLTSPVPEVPDEYFLDFTRNGNRTRFQKPYFLRTTNLTKLAFGEALERKGRFLPKIQEYLKAINAERTWVMSAHDPHLRSFRDGKHFLDLGCGHRIETLAGVLALFREELPAELRAETLAEMHRRAFDPEMSHYARWVRNVYNWNAVCNSCLCRAVLNSVDDRLYRARVIERVLVNTRSFLKGFYSDGYCREGTGYWGYGYGNYLYLGLAVRQATGGFVDFFADPINRKTMLYAYGARTHRGGGLGIADGYEAVGSVFFALGRQVWPDLVGTEALKNNFFNADFTQFPLRAFGQEPPPAKPVMDVMQPRFEFPVAQVWVFHQDPAARTDDLAFVAKGGNNDDAHNHNDVGSYNLVLGGVQLAGDPQGELYVARTFSAHRYDSKVLNSYGHPVPRVAGTLQQQGEKYAAKVLRADFSDAKDEVELELAAAYPLKEGMIKSLKRTFEYDRKGGSVAVTDRFELGEPAAFESPIITYADVIESYEKGVFTLTRGGKQMEVRITASAPWSIKSELIENPMRVSPKRLAIVFDEAQVRGEVKVEYRRIGKK